MFEHLVGSTWRLARRLGTAALVLATLTACGGTAVETADGGDFPECVGDYSGSYGGDVRGAIEGSLARNWSFTVTFSPNNSDQSYTVTGEVAENGTIEMGSALTGSFNFNRCTASGQWNTGEANGNWNAQRE